VKTTRSVPTANMAKPPTTVAAMSAPVKARELLDPLVVPAAPVAGLGMITLTVTGVPDPVNVTGLVPYTAVTRFDQFTLI
jgi:hypothetical protein